jgi:ketosteroid isomerase-like protein
MKNLILVLFLLSSALAQNSPIDPRTSAVLNTIRDWDTAYVTHDHYTIRRLLTDNYIGIDHDGELTTKADEIALAKSGQYTILSVEQIEPRQVRFHGATAVVTSLSNINLKYKGQEKTFKGRATTVCIEKTKGQWEIISWHASKLPDKKAVPARK